MGKQMQKSRSRHESPLQVVFLDGKSQRLLVILCCGYHNLTQLY